MIFVVGDIILDEYVRGDVTRMAPEAPVPVVLLNGESELRLGGAANVAASVAALGEKVSLVGPYCHDRRDDLRRLCADCGVELIGEPEDYGVASARRTTVKTRLVDADGRLLIRMDSESTEPWDGARLLADVLWSGKPNTVVFADYAKGCWTADNWHTIVDYIATQGTRRLLVDAKRTLDMYNGAGIVKCNESEWDRFGGERLCPTESDAVVTKGKGGLSHSWAATAATGRIWSDTTGMPHDVHDVTGAGDVVGAVIAVGLSRGLPMTKILNAAVRASGVSVTQPMTGVADPEQAGLDDV